jgi:hypothetical protein
MNSVYNYNSLAIYVIITYDRFMYYTMFKFSFKTLFDYHMIILLRKFVHLMYISEIIAILSAASSLTTGSMRDLRFSWL